MLKLNPDEQLSARNIMHEYASMKLKAWPRDVVVCANIPLKRVEELCAIIRKHNPDAPFMQITFIKDIIETLTQKG